MPCFIARTRFRSSSNFSSFIYSRIPFFYATSTQPTALAQRGAANLIEFKSLCDLCVEKIDWAQEEFAQDAKHSSRDTPLAPRKRLCVKTPPSAPVSTGASQNARKGRSEALQGLRADRGGGVEISAQAHRRAFSRVSAHVARRAPPVFSRLLLLTRISSLPKTVELYHFPPTAVKSASNPLGYRL